jgi:hypothetical protein
VRRRYGGRRLSRSPSQRTTLIAVALGTMIVLLLGAGVWNLIGDSSAVPQGGPSPNGTGGDEEHPVTFAFHISRLRVAGPSGEAERKAAAPASRNIRDTLTDFYRAAFVDPARWGDGAFPGAFAVFEGGAGDRASTTDLEALTLGPDAARTEWVEPARSRFQVTIVLDRSRRPVAALAAVTFIANAHPVEGDPVRVYNKADYFLRKTSAGWRVYSYRADTAVGGDPVIVPSPVPAGSPA